GNTPETGCSGSTSCDPCPSPPMFSISICTPEGQCDFLCPQPYMRSGMACTCTQECCSDAEGQPGNVCVFNSCGTCDDFNCLRVCMLQCPSAFGMGACINNHCQCDPC